MYLYINLTLKIKCLFRFIINTWPVPKRLLFAIHLLKPSFPKKILGFAIIFTLKKLKPLAVLEGHSSKIYLKCWPQEPLKGNYFCITITFTRMVILKHLVNLIHTWYISASFINVENLGLMFGEATASSLMSVQQWVPFSEKNVVTRSELLFSWRSTSLGVLLRSEKLINL